MIVAFGVEGELDGKLDDDGTLGADIDEDIGTKKPGSDFVHEGGSSVVSGEGAAD